MKKGQIITKILTAAGLKGTKRAAQRKKLEKLTVADLKQVLAQAKQQIAKQQGKAQKKASTKKKSTKKKTTRRSQKVSKSLKSRAAKIVRGIAAGKVAVRQGKAKPSDYASKSAKQRYQQFVALYAGVRVTKGAKKKGPGVAAIYAQIPGAEGRSKFPYYLSPGYHVHAFNVGGGRKGPGLIRKIPGSTAPPFSKLTAAKQAAVVKFLNSAKGQALRTKGAPKTVSLAAMKQAKAKKTKKKATLGSSNWW